MDYQRNDFAINKESEGITYRSVTGEIIVITKGRFLSENPNLTEADFENLKAFSDEDYRVRCNADHTEARRSLPYCDAVELDEYAGASLEDNLADKEGLSKLHEVVDNSLTETQKRRIKFYYVQGLTIRQIAKIESTYFNAVEKSLNQAKRKIKKFLQDS